MRIQVSERRVKWCGECVGVSACGVAGGCSELLRIHRQQCCSSCGVRIRTPSSWPGHKISISVVKKMQAFLSSHHQQRVYSRL